MHLNLLRIAIERITQNGGLFISNYGEVLSLVEGTSSSWISHWMLSVFEQIWSKMPMICLESGIYVHCSKGK